MSARVGQTAPVSAHSLSPQERALCHVASLSSGAPLDPTLRVTLNIEAQVHGLVRLDQHAEAPVLDPSHRGTAVEGAARGLRCPVEWHPGFRLTVDELRRHPDYRGPEYVDLGAEIAVDGRLDPRIIGAARTGRYDPQALKRVWRSRASVHPLGGG